MNAILATNARRQYGDFQRFVLFLVFSGGDKLKLSCSWFKNLSDFLCFAPLIIGDSQSGKKGEGGGCYSVATCVLNDEQKAPR